MLCAARSAVFPGWVVSKYPWPLESPAALRQAAWRPLTVPWDLPGPDLRPSLDDQDAPADDPVDQLHAASTSTGVRTSSPSAWGSPPARGGCRSASPPPHRWSTS